MRYLGWIKGNPQDRHKIKSLGVEGKIIFNHKMGCFEHCNCKGHIIERLIKELPKFWPPSFTAIGTKKKPLPMERQKYWKLP